MICKELIQIVEECAPKKYAENWDNVGLLVGKENQTVEKIMIALDATEDVIDQCVARQVDLLITHHPMLFSSMKRVTWDTVTGRKIMKLVQNDIACYAIHTNFDVCVMATEAANRLELSNQQVLLPTTEDVYYKLVVYVPTDSIDKVRGALTKCGAGYIGNYSDCTFGAKGTGTFRPLEGTSPYIGDLNELEFVDEVRLETIVKEENLDQTIQSMLRVHPYEEVAYDVYQLSNKGNEEGIGRYGYLQEDMTLRQLAEFVKFKFDISNVNVVGDLNKKVARVAISTGAGKSMIQHALKAKVDVLITGDIDHHSALDAKEAGLSIIDASHYGTEHFMVEYMKQYLLSHFDETANHIEVLMAKEEHPFTII